MQLSLTTLHQAESERDARTQFIRTLEAIADGFVCIDRDLRVQFVNRAARQVFNLDSDSAPTDYVGRPLGDIVDPDVLERLEPEIRRALEGQTLVRFEQHLGPPDRWFDISAHPLGDQLSIFFREITDQKRAEAALRRSERRQTILADTAELLEATLGVHSTLDRLAHLVVRWLRDWCVIYLPVPGGLRRAMLAAREPETEMLVRRSIGGLHPESAEMTTMRVMRTRQPLLLHEISQDAINEPAEHDSEYARLLREHRPESAMVVPLVARGDAIGAMALVSTKTDSKFTNDDLTLAVEVARRAALALDSAKLYEDATQRALAESRFVRRLPQLRRRSASTQ